MKIEGQQFDHADFSQTTFAIAYMREDGFDTGAFKNVYDRIKARFPDGHFLYKGISGRHNDDTPAIVAWYTLQLRHFLAHEFDRPELEGGS
nr:accessory Sec system protein Asp2 [Lacticaseibacillus suibinensis]